MATEILSFLGFPRLAVAENAATPNPGVAGVIIWSTTAAKMLVWDAAAWVAFAAGAPGGDAIFDGGSAASVTPAAGNFDGGTASG